jgi:two-component system sensor histidine kinase/response regulator
VHDTGIGLTAEAKSKLFNKFQQADGSTTRRFGGTGLGLSICRDLLDLMGGRIDMVDRAGGGSIFWLVLPLQTVSATPAEPAVIGAPKAAPLLGRRILMVGEASLSHGIHARWLEEAGASVERIGACETRFEALTRAEAESSPYDLIVLDLAEPGPATETLARLAHSGTDGVRPPLVLISETTDPQRARDMPFEAILTRPLRRCAFLESLGALMAPIDDLAPSPDTAQGAAPAEEDLPATETLGLVLLAEDNAINTLLARTLLESAGFQVECVVNGAQAVEAVRGRDFDLILMDVQMPIMGGLEATGLIRAMGGRQGEVPIIAMTASAMAADQQACLDAGMNGFISKPIDPAAFIDTLEAISWGGEDDTADVDAADTISIG